MARWTSRWVIGAQLLAALLIALPAVSAMLVPDTTSLAYSAAVAIAVVAALAIAGTATAVPVPGLTRLSHAWDRAPDELTRQSDPSAAGHSRPRAPDHS